MADNTDRVKVLKLPLYMAGFVALCLVLSRPGQEVAPAPRRAIDSQEQARIVVQGIEQGTAALAAGTHSPEQIERNLRLRLDGTPERALEVAGGLYAVALKDLELGNSPEATRVSQLAADLVPGSPIAARCWLLCGQASAVTSPDLPLSIRYFERANVTLIDRLKQHPQDAEAVRLRATVLHRLSQTEARFDRNDEAIRHLRELTGATPEAHAQSPGDQLRVMAALGQQLLETSASAEAAKWLASAEEWGQSEVVPPLEALHILAESARRQANHPLAPSHDALRKVWETRRFESLPEWFLVGDELTSAYYFHEPRQLADFELVSGKLLATLPPVLGDLPPGVPQRSELESLYATNLLLAADAARSRADQSELDRLVKLFESTFQDRDVNFTAPLDRPAQRMHRLGEIYRSTMSGHVEQLRKLQASGTIPPRL